MDLLVQLHLACALGAAALGAGALVRAPRRPANAAFTVLALAIAAWNAGVVIGVRTGDVAWSRLAVAGGLATGPAALALALALSGVERRTRRAWTAAATAAAGGLWLTVWTRLYFADPGWNLTAMMLLAVLYFGALGLIVRRALRLRLSAERRAYVLVAAAGVVAVVGGLSDFVPRGEPGVPKVGQIAVLLFLLVVAAILARHRFLDIHVFLARAVVVLIAGALAAALLLLASRAGFLPLFAVATVVVLIAARYVGPLLAPARSATPEGTIAAALETVGRGLRDAEDRAAVWAAVARGREALPAGMTLGIFVRGPGGEFEGADNAQHRAAGVLADWLERDGAPATLRTLDEAARTARGPDRAAADVAFESARALGAELVVPQIARGRVAALIVLGGGDPGHYVRPEVAAAVHALAQNVAASLERIDALDRAAKREALAAVGELAAGLAHEIRNPVAAIGGAVDLLGPAGANEMVDVIREESSRLARLAQEFLDYARPGAPVASPTDLGALVRAVVREAGLAGLSMPTEIDVDPAAGPAFVDPEQLRRALANLVRNAREAAGPAGHLRIAVGRGERGITLTVEDDGPGLSGEALATLFRPFHSSKPGGTGLGLALVHRVVEANGGAIDVERGRARGASFTITLPAGGTE